MFPRNHLPGFYTEKKNNRHYFKRHKQVKILIDEHNGQLVKFKDLPKPAQLVLVEYMTVEGEAWECHPNWNDWRQKDYPEYNLPKYLRKSLPFYIKKYGDTIFGYIQEVPIQDLIEFSILAAEKREDWAAADSWYVTAELYAKTKKVKSKKSLQPVILASFDDEILQYGWELLHDYIDRSLESCSAVFFPHNTKPS